MKLLRQQRRWAAESWDPHSLTREKVASRRMLLLAAVTAAKSSPALALVFNQLFFQTKRKGWGDRDTIGGQGLPGSRFLNLQSGCTTAYAFLEKLF